MPPEREMRSDERIPANTVYRQIVVTIDEKAPFEIVEAEVYQALEDARIRYTRLASIPEPGIIAVELDEGQDVLEVLRMLNGLPGVRFAEQNHYLGVTALVPPPPVDDPLYRFQWALTRIAAERAWQHPAPTTPVVVAILDTGISTVHPDLLAHLWDDGAGNHGFNVLTGTNDVEDEDGHGTLLAGTIAAVSNNMIGVAGAPWPIRLMAVKFHDVRTRPNALNAIIAIVWAVLNGAKVINAAWHLGLRLGFVEVAIAFANARDVVFVAGAGNDGLNNDMLPTYPASYPVDNVVSVMATNEHDAKPGFSNYGKTTVHLAAPGVRILSTDCFLRAPRWRSYSGTSPATACVAQAAAVLKAMNPAWTPRQIREHLVASVDRVPRWLPCVAEGRLALGRAVCGPLAITAPLAGVAWQAGTNRQVTWTSSYATPRCTTVRVLFSADGGLTWDPTALANAQAVAALGCTVTVPAGNIPQARIKLESEQGPGLFDISGVFRVT
jgi:subtilisin family serine protease